MEDSAHIGALVHSDMYIALSWGYGFDLQGIEDTHSCSDLLEVLQLLHLELLEEKCESF